jgi:2-polyprenyl-6-methoxyphenol hydroxylase-like FAD-dependent oxidoreductase
VTDFDVIVVGGGPSGLTTAAEVARTGATVLVLEKRAVEPVPRAGTVLPRPLELFDARGISDRFIRRTAELGAFPFQVWYIWGGMHPVDWRDRDSRFGFTLFLPQHEAETILRDWAKECGAEIRFQWEVTRIEQDQDEVQVAVRPAGETERVITAKYLIGADSARSLTRKAAGIAFEGRDATFTGVVATTEMEFPWQGGLKVGHNEKGWLTSYRFGAGLTRFTIIHAEGRYQKAKDDPVTVEEISGYVSDILGEPITLPNLRAATRYDDAMRMAARFRERRIFLVGESARVHYPASGVGMNFCMQDAFNLGWKLGAVLAGRADESILDTYDTERRPIAKDLFDSVDAQVAVQFNFTRRGLAFSQHFMKHFMQTPDVMSQLWDELNGLETPYARPADAHPAVGFPVPDFDLHLSDGSSTRLYELLREGEFIVLHLTGTALRGLSSAKSSVRVVAAHAGRRPKTLRGVNALVVRPDTYLAWATTGAPTAEDVRAAVNRWVRWPQ